MCIPIWSPVCLQFLHHKIQTWKSGLCPWLTSQQILMDLQLSISVLQSNEGVWIIYTRIVHSTPYTDFSNLMLIFNLQDINTYEWSYTWCGLTCWVVPAIFIFILYFKHLQFLVFSPKQAMCAQLKYLSKSKLVTEKEYKKYRTEAHHWNWYSTMDNLIDCRSYVEMMANSCSYCWYNWWHFLANELSFQTS